MQENIKEPGDRENTVRTAGMPGTTEDAVQPAGMDQTTGMMQAAGDAPLGQQRDVSERERAILSTVVLAVLLSGPFLIGAFIWLAELLSWGTDYTTASSALGALLLTCIGVAILAGLFLSLRQRLRELKEGESELAKARNY